MKAKVKRERSVTESLKEKGMERGREWYQSKRNENMTGNVGVESLKVNVEVIRGKEGIGDNQRVLGRSRWCW